MRRLTKEEVEDIYWYFLIYAFKESSNGALKIPDQIVGHKQIYYDYVSAHHDIKKLMEDLDILIK